MQATRAFTGFFAGASVLLFWAWISISGSVSASTSGSVLASISASVSPSGSGSESLSNPAERGNSIDYLHKTKNSNSKFSTIQKIKNQ